MLRNRDALNTAHRLRALLVVKPTLRVVPCVVLISEAAVLRTLVALVVAVILVIALVAVIPRFPTGRLFRDGWIKLSGLIFIFTLLCGEGVVEVVYTFGIVRRRIVWVKSFADFLFLPFFGVCVTGIVSAADG